jgi:hypothetical protein
MDNKESKQTARNDAEWWLIHNSVDNYVIKGDCAEDWVYVSDVMTAYAEEVSKQRVLEERAKWLEALEKEVPKAYDAGWKCCLMGDKLEGWDIEHTMETRKKKYYETEVEPLYNK